MPIKQHFTVPYQSKPNKQTTRSNLEWSELDWVLNQPEEQETNSTSTIPDWTKCKLLGRGMLDTETDIRARKNKTIDIRNLYKHFFTTRRLFNNQVEAGPKYFPDTEFHTFFSGQVPISLDIHVVRTFPDMSGARPSCRSWPDCSLRPFP